MLLLTTGHGAGASTAMRPVTSVLIKRGNVDTDPQKECHVEMKAEIRTMLLQAEEHQILPENHQKMVEQWLHEYFLSLGMSQKFIKGRIPGTGPPS